MPRQERDLVIATDNRLKIQEIKEYLKELLPDIHSRSLFDFPAIKLPELQGTIQEDAGQKALVAAQQSRLPAVSESCLIVIPSIQEALPEILKNSNKRLLAKNILAEMKGLKELARSAFLECAMAFALPQGIVKVVTARMEGFIADEEQGRDSCDFESIFIKHDYMKTLAELPPRVRGQISCRRKAVEKLLPYLQK